MKKVFFALMVIAAAILVFNGCKTKDPGSREYIPEKGWKPVN